MQGWATLFNPGSDRPQGPWDPDEKKRYLDTTYFWTLLPVLVILVLLLVFVAR